MRNKLQRLRWKTQQGLAWQRQLSARDNLALHLRHDNAVIQVRPRRWKSAISLRRNGIDSRTLWSAVVERFHLPPHRIGETATILDLGSNIGLTLVDLHAEYPRARIVGVEMDGDNFHLAMRNTSGMKNVQIMHCAVSTQSGLVRYGKNSRADGYRIKDVGNDLVECPSRTIGDILSAYRIDRVDYLKMDVEGTEHDLFGGDCDWLDAVGSLNVEVHGDGLESILHTLNMHGFDAWKSSHHWSAVHAVRKTGPRS
jgi:FkbM family methyltransferase